MQGFGWFLTRRHVFLLNKETRLLLNKKTCLVLPGDMSSCWTRRHVFLSNQKTCLLVEQKDTSSLLNKKTSLLFLPNKKTCILAEQEHVFWCNQKTCHLVEQEKVWWFNKKTCNCYSRSTRKPKTTQNNTSVTYCLTIKGSPERQLNRIIEHLNWKWMTGIARASQHSCIWEAK